MIVKTLLLDRVGQEDRAQAARSPPFSLANPVFLPFLGFPPSLEALINGFSSAADVRGIREEPGPSGRFVAQRDVITEGFEVGLGGLEGPALPQGKGLWWRRCSLSIVKVPSPPQIPPPGCPYASSYRTQVVCARSKTSGVFLK